MIGELVMKSGNKLLLWVAVTAPTLNGCEERDSELQ